MAHLDQPVTPIESDPPIPTSTWLALAAAVSSLFLFMIDAGLMSVSRPAMEADFSGSSRALLSWASTGYLVAVSSLLLVAGRMADRSGRKRYYLGGVVGFGCSSVLTALAPTAELLIAARVCQGIAAAFLTSSALALVLPLFPESRRGVVVGIWGGVGAVAAVIAPTAGGLLIDRAGWRWPFAIVGPMALAVYVVGRKVLIEQRNPELARIGDRIGVIIGPAGLGLLALVLSQGRRWEWTSSSTLVIGVAAVALIAAFIGRCRTIASPLLDLTIFRITAFRAHTSAAACQQVGFFSWYLTAPLIFTSLWGWSVLQAGSALALGQAFAAISGPLGGRWVDRYGPIGPITGSALLTALGPIWLIVGVTERPDFWRTFLPATILIGFGGGICGILTTGAALGRLDGTILGAANSLHQLIRRVGGTIGAVLGSTLLGDAIGGKSLLTGARLVWGLVAVAHLAMCVPLLTATWRRTSDQQR